MKFIVIVAALAAAPFIYAQEGAKQPDPASPKPADPAKPAPEPVKPPAGGGAGGAAQPTADPVVANVRVAASSKNQEFLEAAGHDVVQLGDDVIVSVKQWEKLRAAARAAQKPVTLYINGLDAQLQPIAIAGDKDVDLTFRLGRNDKNKDLWRDVLRDPTEEEKTLHLSAGVSGSGQPLPLAANAPNGTVRLDKITLAGVGIFWLTVITLLVAGLLFLCVTTDMLRNGPKTDDDPQPFSLARTQMAWWFVLIILAYILIWAFTGERDTIPLTLLALLGISAATAMGAAVIDTTKEQRNAAATEDLQAQKKKLDSSVPEGDDARPAVTKRIEDINATISARNLPKKRGRFLMDLLTDDNGQIALHRYQIVGWTIVLGIIFVATVVRDLSMPEFSGTLLALMGISSGTYLGFKLPS